MGGTEFFLITVGFPVVCGTLIAITLIIVNATKKHRSDSLSSEEAKMFQEMHQSLIRMEKRIDALETIYFEADRFTKEKSK